MGARNYWDRMLVYFGIAEEAYDESDDRADERPTSGSSRRSAAAARDEWDDDPTPRPSSRQSSRRTAPPSRARGSSSSQNVAGVGVVPPRTFNDAQKIADQFKDGRPVIVNLQTTDPDLAKRLIDFASGLTYGLDGSMSRIADKVFLLTPPDVDVSDEDRAAMLESGFFNQS